jgi:enoyl-CoA hydratase/carnithine racemase
MEYTVVLIDNPAPYVRRVTLNRPEKRNALDSVLRHEIVTAVREGEADPGVRVTIIAANGPSFCGGHDLAQNVKAPATPSADYPYTGAGTELSIVNGHSEGGRQFINNIRELGLTAALSIRDAPFNDGRTALQH